MDGKKKLYFHLLTIADRPYGRGQIAIGKHGQSSGTVGTITLEIEVCNSRNVAAKEIINRLPNILIHCFVTEKKNQKKIFN